ncbi:hypothetical protein GQ600_15287 [Phytophthora cactorum]|nr:hypothetical protein GQ600_15287 [Phytophthora cactorum]
MAQQNIDFNRGSNVAGELVYSGEKLIGVGTGGGGTTIEFVGGNGTDYLSWGNAKHPAAAKLFMNWAISQEAQTTVVPDSVRTDINANKPWNIPKRTWRLSRSSWRTAPRWSSGSRRLLCTSARCRENPVLESLDFTPASKRLACLVAAEA